MKRKIDENNGNNAVIKFSEVFLPMEDIIHQEHSTNFNLSGFNGEYIIDPLNPAIANSQTFKFHNYCSTVSTDSHQYENVQSLYKSRINTQDDNCFLSSSKLPQCHECAKNIMTNKYTCRFFDFRKLQRDSNSGSVQVVGFLDPQEDPTDKDLKIWMINDEKLQVDEITRNYIVKFLVHVFCELSKAEKRVREEWKKEIIWKRPVIQVREQCDVCNTSLFNLHWTCTHCGANACIDCYEERKRGLIRWKPKSKIDKEERDKFFWLKCNQRKEHDLALTQIITDTSMETMNEIVHQICREKDIPNKCVCQLENKKVTKSMPNDTFLSAMKRLRYRSRKQYDISGYISDMVAHKRISKNRIIKFDSPSESEETYAFFQNQWERGLPVVVANSNRNMNKSIWKPEYFSKKFGNEKHEMVDCKNGATIKQVDMKHFWNGFDLISTRIPKDHNEKVVLKLKDWPTSDDFANVMTEHFEDLMKAVPMSAYSTRDGKHNLARYLPDFFSKPDLGPKMYSAYSQIYPARQASTNLHLDVSDAVNMMVHVSRPKDYLLASKQYSKEAMKHALEEAGADHEDILNIENSDKLPGAIWHIWEANQADSIRKVLKNESVILRKPQGEGDDPIHDQNWFIDKELRLKLEAEGTVGYTIVQYEGDAVFIPAGAPHQVLNILDCIKVALDFVASENLPECVNLTEEFRALSTKHQNHEDKLQIKNIMYHTLKNLVPLPSKT